MEEDLSIDEIIEMLDSPPTMESLDREIKKLEKMSKKNKEKLLKIDL